MNRQIDLHGMTEAQANMKIIPALSHFETSNEDMIVFITGRGEVLRRVLEDHLRDFNLSWRHEGSNTGSYTVFKRRR